MSRWASASGFLSLAFSASNSRTHRASEASMPPNLARHLEDVASLNPPVRQTSLTGMPASAYLRMPTICSAVNLLFFMSVILLGGGLHQLYAGRAGGRQVKAITVLNGVPLPGGVGRHGVVRSP